MSTDSDEYLDDEEEEGEPEEPEEGDITTEDHKKWFQYGKLYYTGGISGLLDKMEDDKFFPNVWFISDHGNAHLMEISDEDSEEDDDDDDDEEPSEDAVWDPKTKRWVEPEEE